MENFWKSSISVILLAFICSLALNAQSDQPSKDKEVIIIEKVKDEDGNIISKKIIRSDKGDMSEKEIEEALKEAEDNPFGQFGNMNFGNENFDFGNLFGQSGNPTSDKPTLGVVLKSGDDQIVIDDVAKGSGAEEAELRSGDIIISADGFVMSTIDDLKNHIAKKNKGDKVLLSVIRDGQSFEKEVTLKVNNFNSNPFGNINPDAFKSFGQMFDFGDGGSFNMDSLFQQLGGMDGLKDLNKGGSPFQFDMPGYSDRVVEEERPSLGVFIDEVEDGVVIAEIVEDSPAENGKLQVNDKIIEIDGKEIRSFDDLASHIRAAGKNTQINITFLRNGKTKQTKVTLQ